MIDVDLLSVVRRWHGREGLSIREIQKRTGLSRITIRKYLASGVTEPKYPARKSVSKLDPYAETLLSWLKRESGGNRKRRRNLKQLYRDLAALGYAGSYVTGSPPLLVTGGNENARKPTVPGVEPLCPWFSPRVRPSSSTGARTGRESVHAR